MHPCAQDAVDSRHRPGAVHRHAVDHRAGAWGLIRGRERQPTAPTSGSSVRRSPGSGTKIRETRTDAASASAAMSLAPTSSAAWIMMCAHASASAVASWCAKSMNPAAAATEGRR